MATISPILSPNFSHKPQSTKPSTTHFYQLSKLSLFNSNSSHNSLKFNLVSNIQQFNRVSAAGDGTVLTKQDPSLVAARKLFFGNIPRTLTDDELKEIVQQHGVVEQVEVIRDKITGRGRRFAFVTMRTVEDANVVAQKLDGTQIEGHEIKVNVTQKPLVQLDVSIPQSEESQFVDSPHKLHVGNLAKTATSESLKRFFAKKGKVLSAKILGDPGTLKSSRFGFVTFSSEEEVEAAIKDFNNEVFEGQKIHVKKA